MIPCTYTCMNVGDVAMLQVAVSRLNALWPAASIEVPTKSASALLVHCPTVSPLAQGDWFAEHYLLGRVHRSFPVAFSQQLIGLKKGIRKHWPALEELAIKLKLRIAGNDPFAFSTYQRAVKSADLVVVSGAGGIADVFPSFSLTVMDLLDMAVRRGVPTAMFSHGFGPLRDSRLTARARAVLPKVDLIAIRERRAGYPLLRSLGVAERRIVVTGDDAIETAYEARPARRGTDIGVNARTMEPAGVGDEVLETIRPVLQRFAARQKVRLLPIPIALQGGVDAQAIEKLLRGYENPCDLGRSLDTPLKVVDQITRCRVVLTGAYHAAVFALSMGIPAVCVAKSEYFANKFFGLADQFGKGCETVLLDQPQFPAELSQALERAWNSTDKVRVSLLKSAAQQLEASRSAYERVGELMRNAAFEAAA